MTNESENEIKGFSPRTWGCTVESMPIAPLV